MNTLLFHPCHKFHLRKQSLSTEMECLKDKQNQGICQKFENVLHYIAERYKNEHADMIKNRCLLNLFFMCERSIMVNREQHMEFLEEIRDL